MESLDIENSYALNLARQYLRSQWLKLSEDEISLSVLR